jgi:hypothetical protein
MSRRLRLPEALEAGKKELDWRGRGRSSVRGKLGRMLRELRGRLRRRGIRILMMRESRSRIRRGVQMRISLSRKGMVRVKVKVAAGKRRLRKGW